MPNDAPFILRAVSMPEELPEMLSGTVNGETIRRDRIALEHFEKLIGSTIMVEGANATTPFEVVEVTEKPKSQFPGQQRMPFSVLLRGAENITFDGCHFNLHHPQLGLIPYLMLSRTMVFPDQPTGAYFEIMFN